MEGMINIILISLLIIGGHCWPSGSVPSCPAGNIPTCPLRLTATNMFIEHPNNCHYFIQCDAASQPICKECPSNLYFNPALKVCDYPTNVQCKYSQTTQTSRPRITQAPTPRPQTTILTSGGNACSLAPPTQSCPNLGSNEPNLFLAQPQNPECYYVCLNGQPQLRHCPGNMEFSQQRQLCE